MSGGFNDTVIPGGLNRGKPGPAFLWVHNLFRGRQSPWSHRFVAQSGMAGIAAMIAVIFLCTLTAARADFGPEKLSDPAQEARAAGLQRGFRCLVCQGESLDESNAQLADDLRRLIRAQIMQGRSDEEIRSFLVARYGNVILMKPPLEADTYALWFGPFVILLAGAGIATVVILRARRRTDGPV